MQNCPTTIYLSVSSFKRRDDYSHGFCRFFFDTPEVAKKVPKSSTKFYGVKLNHLAYGTEPKIFFRVTYITGRD